MTHTPTASPRLTLGRFGLTQSPEPAAGAALALRALCFRGGTSDRDSLDALCQHVTVADAASGQTVAAFRLLVLPDAQAMQHSYSARFYDLSRIAPLGAPALELGRFCLHPDWHHPDILRLCWAALSRIVDRHAIRLLLGCSSFAGADPWHHRDALSHLARHHLAPAACAPLRKAPPADVVDYPALTARHTPAPRAAIAALPPLLRTYLAMGGWVSDHAVIDRDLDTLHVFTGVEIARIPPARVRALRTLAMALTGDSTIDLGPRPV